MSKPIEINCPICNGTGKVDASDTVITFDYFIQKIIRLHSLIDRMSAVGDELLQLRFHYDFDGHVWCGYCESSIAEKKEDIVCAPDCPVTRWERLRKEINCQGVQPGHASEGLAEIAKKYGKYFKDEATHD